MQKVGKKTLLLTTFLCVLAAIAAVYGFSIPVSVTSESAVSKKTLDFLKDVLMLDMSKY